jgi:UDP-glucose 4-epimerase
MKILITGGAGFIGSHLTERCLREGWSVFVLDDLSTGSLENIRHLVDHPQFKFWEGSVLDASLVEALVNNCDVVFHLAAVVGVGRVMTNPLRTIETNINGTEAVLRAAARNGKRMALISTSEVYGKNTKIPFCEDDDLTLGPTSKERWSYACSKMMDEFFGLAYWKERQVPVTIVRLFNTVGPRQSRSYGMVLPNFVYNALEGKPIVVHGDGTQRRCFGYVLDVVEALIRIVKTDVTVGEVLNIGNDEEITVANLAHVVRTLLESQSEIVYIPYSKIYGSGFEDMMRRVPSLEKLERLIGYRPRTSLETIVHAVADEMRSNAAMKFPAILSA